MKNVFFTLQKRPRFLAALLVLIGFVFLSECHAATITSAATGNWGTGATWVGGVAPVAGDNAVIANDNGGVLAGSNRRRTASKIYTNNGATPTDPLSQSIPTATRQARVHELAFIDARVPDYTWDGGAGTNERGEANNWNSDGVPISTDDISLTGANTIDVNVAGVCNDLTLIVVEG